MKTYEEIVKSHRRHDVLLRVKQEFISSGLEGFSFFDEPENISRASEGFCPFNHLVEDKIQLVKLERLSDGKVLCLEDQVKMQFDWITLE